MSEIKHQEVEDSFQVELTESDLGGKSPFTHLEHHKHSNGRGITRFNGTVSRELFEWPTKDIMAKK